MAGPRAHPRRRIGVALCAATVTALIGAGCPDSDPPPPGSSDAGLPELDSSPGMIDSDSDGLCNDTEFTRGTDPFDGDTDGDGYGDWVEVVYGYDPLQPGEPDRDTITTMRENLEASVAVELSVDVNGRGEDFAGAFESLIARDPLGVTAEDFYAGSVALYANPLDHAALVEPEAQRFLQVEGLTELSFEVRFSYDEEDLVRRCLRAYPWRYSVKRSDGRLVFAPRRLLVIVPEGDSIARGEWCVPDGPCT